jgi:uncharacterized circularly permuted ATP-grasp superfamily protein
MIENSLLTAYQEQPNIWDEMFHHNSVRPEYRNFVSAIEKLPTTELARKDELARKLFMSQGVTFTVYSSGEGIEKIFPFDIIPRIIQHAEWLHIEAGIKQRLKALNLFLKDIYHEQFILKDGLIPATLIYSCPQFLREMINVKVPHDIYTHIAGVDLIRDSDGQFYVLEDNLRTPSGVSYMLENRSITSRLYPDLLPKNSVQPVRKYPELLFRNLMDLADRHISTPTVVLLSPGIYNSAYYEHATLARLMGIELVQGSDLVVHNHYVFMKTTKGLKQVDVIYRRVDDEFLDPLVFRPDSALGVPGMYAAYRKGNVAIVNAMGNGVADDKAVYCYVPQMIRYYLNEEPILQTVPTYQMSDPDLRKMVFERMDRMVIKKTNESGGYGMLIGSSATEQQMQEFREAITQDPRSFIAQPIISLSSTPCYLNGVLQPRRVDLRPYALYGPQGIDLVPGGLTRVALQEGSLVVNSSQGGGSKDTWVLGPENY